ncbi:DUF1127 domain-containing protein [Labrys neptuniae]
MFDWIRDIVGDLLAERQRRANIDYFEGLSDRVLRDIGIDRCDIEKIFDRDDPYWRSQRRSVADSWAILKYFGGARKHNGAGGYGV